MAYSQASAASPARGVIHVRTRHTERFTVVGNHLAQHGEMSLTAIGLAVHIQSLPEGARIDIKSLAARFPEGETRIAAALRELEANGYLTRTRERLPSGRVVTRTVSYDRPGASRPGAHAAPARPAQPARPPAPGRGGTVGTVRRERRPRPPYGPVRTANADTGSAPPPAGPTPPEKPPPFQDCDGCNRVFRAWEPGLCGDCRTGRTRARPERTGVVSPGNRAGRGVLRRPLSVR